MRYTGGLLGGSWLTALTGDLGDGIFDGAALVQNFESLNPSNTLWSKQHDLYAKVDSEGPRYLGFEKWWGGHVLLNAGEMQWITDNLFVGNRLATAEIVTRDGRQLQHRHEQASRPDPLPGGLPRLGLPVADPIPTSSSTRPRSASRAATPRP
jgi:hypothetical protein